MATSFSSIHKYYPHISGFLKNSGLLCVRFIYCDTQQCVLRTPNSWWVDPSLAYVPNWATWEAKCIMGLVSTPGRSSSMMCSCHPITHAHHPKPHPIWNARPVRTCWHENVTSESHRAVPINDQMWALGLPEKKQWINAKCLLSFTFVYVVNPRTFLSCLPFLAIWCHGERNT